MFDRDDAKLANSTYVYIYSYKKKPGNTFRFHTLAKNAFVCVKGFLKLRFMVVVCVMSSLIHEVNAENTEHMTTILVSLRDLYSNFCNH